MKETNKPEKHPLEKGVEEDEMIAVFMGEKVWNYGTSPVYIEGPGFPNDPPYEVGYRTSWDDLMPVVEKISKMRPVNQAWYDVKYSLMEANIAAVYKCVVSYIKLYNQQSK